MTSSIRFPTHMEAIMPQNRVGFFVITCGPGMMPNVIQHPVPTPRRFYKLGQAIRHAVETYPEDLNVLVVSTGGMSHQLHGSRFGLMNPEWDNEFLDRL